MKKLILLLLAVMLALPAFAFEYTYGGQILTYTVIDEDAKTVSVSKSGSDIAGDLTIPANPVYYGVTYTVTSIESYAFYCCSSLTSVIIPNSVKYIEDWAFEYCNSLTSVTISNSVKSIEVSTFWCCSSLTSVTIPNSVTSIGTNAFAGCSSLTSVTIPNSVTYIGEIAFAECSNLTSVTIPNSVTYIGGSTFYRCSSLTSVYYNTTEPIEADSDIFDSMTYTVASLYVPESAIEIFKQTSPWMYFQNIKGHNFSGGINDITIGLDEAQPCEFYNLSGVKMGNTKDSLAPGFYIMHQGNESKKITVK